MAIRWRVWEGCKNHTSLSDRGVGKVGSNGTAAPIVFYAAAPLVFLWLYLWHTLFFDSTPLFKFVPVDLCICCSFSM